jgi:hypothetical protein
MLSRNIRESIVVFAQETQIRDNPQISQRRSSGAENDIHKQQYIGWRNL